jgi:hypothetical protein
VVARADAAAGVRRAPASVPATLRGGALFLPVVAGAQVLAYVLTRRRSARTANRAGEPERSAP